MTSYAMFLRGINVGGVRVSMSELRRVLERLGCRDVQTWLNTGNVTVDDERSVAALQRAAEAAISEAFGYEAHVIVRPRTDLAELVASWPFGSPDGCHRYVVLGGAVAEDDVVAALGGPRPSAGEAVAVVGDDLMWCCPKGVSTTSPVARALARKHLRALTTTRNLNTIEKML